MPGGGEGRARQLLDIEAESGPCGELRPTGKAPGTGLGREMAPKPFM
jgi:hypothetical protein